MINITKVMKILNDILLLSCIITVIVMLGCSRNVEEKDLGYNLVCFTEYGDDGSNIKGVKRKTDGMILVSPSLYASISADSCFIVASKSTYSHEVWKTDGTYIGKFDTFTGFKRGFYIGTRYRTTALYFPHHDLLLYSEHVIMGKHAICIQLDSIWQVMSYDGRLISKSDAMPSQEKWDIINIE